MCYNLINAYIPDKYVLLLFFTMFHQVCVCVQLLCENENANGNALWFVCVLFEGGDFEGGPCQIT